MFARLAFFRLPLFQAFGVLALSLAVFIPFSFQRLIGQDEGFYLYAAKLIQRGELPYLDFFYPQTPGIPYLWGIWMALVGVSWESSRILAAIFAALVVVSGFMAARMRFGMSYAMVLAAALILSPWCWAFFIWAKPFAPTALFLFIAFLLVELRPSHRETPWIAGILVGLATCLRLYAGVVGPLLLAALVFKNSRGAEQRRAMLTFLVGGLIGASPLVAFFLLDPELFWFNNVTYHLNRQNFSVEEITANRLLVFHGLFTPHDGGEVSVLHFPIFAALTAVHTLLRISKGSLPSLATLHAIILSAVSALPVPTYVQYFILAFPFLVWSSAELFFDLSRYPWFTRAALCLSLIAFGYRIPNDWDRYTVHGRGLVSRDDGGWVRRSTIRHVQNVSEVINAHTSPGEKIIAMWPGHLVESHADAVSGLENHFGVRIATKLGIPQDDRKKIISRARLDEMMHSGEVRVIAVFPSSATYIVPKIARLKELGYRRVFNDSGVSVFVRGES